MKEEMKKCMKKLVIVIFTAAMIVMSAFPAFAASKYGEEKPLKSARTLQLTVHAGHKHTYIDANNGVRYQLYDSCMNGMVRTTPTNHLSTVTIDGVKYSLGNYGYKNKGCSYANVIKRIGGASTPLSSNIPLSKITLSKASLTISVGTTANLSVSFTPANTTESKLTTWSSSNTAVATVSGGKITARKAGSTTITAKVGSKKATCKVTVKAASSGTGSAAAPGSSEGYINVTEAYTLVNSFRTNRANQWYWNQSNTGKITTYGLKGLARDASLEATAKTRAREAWQLYYEKGNYNHVRPDGSAWSTAYPAGYSCRGENLAWGQTTCRMVILDPDWGWAETNKTYAYQGHRRAMLDARFTKVGIACYTKNGKTAWAMCLGG